MKLTNGQLKVIIAGLLVIGLNALLPPWRNGTQDRGRHLIFGDSTWWVDVGGYRERQTGEVDIGALIAESILFACATAILVALLELLRRDEDDFTNKVGAYSEPKPSPQPSTSVTGEEESSV